MKLYCSLSNPPLGGLAIVELIKDKHPCNIEWGLETSIITNTDKKQYVTTPVGLLRIMARDLPNYQFYGNSVSERTQIDQWLTFSLCMTGNVKESLDKLQTSLTSITYLVGNRLTIADLAVFNALYSVYDVVEKTGIPIHVQRWYNLIRGQQCVENVLANLPTDVKKLQQEKLPTDTAEANVVTSAGDRKREGKFVDLPGAEMGKVIVRFPPEASGFLHIGHAKAALLNQYYQETFNGKLVMRFDDTNPAKETLEFELVILEDLKMLEIKPDIFTHTSDYFDIMLKYCEQLLTDGKAYVDDTEPEQMKKEREQKIEAINRSNSVAKNFEMWKEMLNGTARGQQCCVRAKMDMSSANGCMRDPTIYRCKNEPHPRTGTKYKVYPTYDFACPIVDAIENVTHTLRTTEYHDRDDQFYWFIDNLKLRKPYIWEYSRLNMTNTVLSKRKLTWFVDQGHVDGWDDPRFPTVRGILRRGMTVAGLKEFIIAQGSSKSVVFMEWDKIWAFNKKFIDPIAPRYTALVKNHAVRVNVSGCNKREMIEVPAHPKNIDIGMKQIWIGPTILIDDVDAVQLCENENVTFINWGNLLIRKINKLANGCIDTIDAELNLSNKDFKKTLKLTWLCEMESDDDYPPTFCVYFNHIISKAILAKNEDFKDFIGHKTRSELEMLGDPELKKCKKGDIIQLQRRGFFKVDNAYVPPSSNSGVASPIVLFEIPDGHTKEKQTGGTKTVVPVKEMVIQQPNTSNAINGTLDGATLNVLITKQGDIVRNLKTQKATKSEIDSAVKELLKLKTDYKTITGTDWKPSSSSTTTTSAPVPKQPAPAIPGKDIDISKKPDNIKINEDILKQGNIVRDLKSKKATKDEIDAAVKELLKLKTDYKTITGTDWKPSSSSTTTTSAPVPKQPAPAIPGKDIDISKKPDNVIKINEDILKQGNIVRDLKSKKATKDEIDAAVKELLKLKTDYKTITGTDWKPSSSSTTTTSAPVPKQPAPAILGKDIDISKKPDNVIKINEDILKQGNIVRDLKSKKATKDEIDVAVKCLLTLKTNYKNKTGLEWKPGCAADSNTTSVSVISKPSLSSQLKEMSPPTLNSVTVSSSNQSSSDEKQKNELTIKIGEQGDLVRILKSSGAIKSDIDSAVKHLINLKEQYKNVTGEDFPVPASTKTSRNKSTDNKCKEKKDTTKKENVGNKTNKSKTDIIDGTGGTTGAGAVKKQTRLGLEAKKEENLPDWYSQVITKGEMIEYYDVSGCYILRHWSFAIWKFIKNWFDAEITKLGVKECYFPIFVSRAALEKEKSHITDFAPEVAWVTKSGESDLAEPIAVRPTSETVMYPAYAKWIQSYRDLPLRLNQWNNVVRWEFKHPQPFLRTREFLWQEGHTAFATAKEAQDEVLQILDLYAKIYTDLLAIPVVKGRKTEKEKFAGGDFTTTVEAFVSASGRAIQGATSHYLGQNFSKMFDIVYEDPVTQEKEYVHQNSWGITTRTIGVMVMVHADNQGLVLPPRVACIQVIIVPCGITATTSEQEKEKLYRNCKEMEIELLKNGVRSECDFRDNYSPGWKFNHWELKGVPIRIELGPKDIKLNQFIAVRRDTGEKLTIKRNEMLTKCVIELLDNIHASMYQKATADLSEHTKVSKNWTEFCKFLDSKNIILSPFCGDQKCEEKIKGDSARDDAEAEPGAPAMGAKTLCIPFEQPTHLLESDKCIHPSCQNKPNAYVLFGRSY